MKTCNHNGCNYPESDCGGACSMTGDPYLLTRPAAERPMAAMPIQFAGPEPTEADDDTGGIGWLVAAEVVVLIAVIVLASGVADGWLIRMVIP